MAPQNVEMLQWRIKALQVTGQIGEAVAVKLAGRNQADEPARAGKLYFSFTEAPLKDELRVGDLFRYWGGEALYNSHDKDPQTGPVLAAIGSPRLVEVCLPVIDLRTPALPMRQMTQQFLASRGLSALDRDYVDSTTRPVAAASISRILSAQDVDFDSLTGFHKWRGPLSLNEYSLPEKQRRNSQ